jgi:hypothetical protein
VLPKHLDEKVAALHLDKLSVKLTALSPAQARYLDLPTARSNPNTTAIEESAGQCPQTREPQHLTILCRHA